MTKNTSKHRAEEILKLIRQRHRENSAEQVRRRIELKDQIPQPRYRKLHADDYQKFKRKFVESVGGEPVQDTGMTHSEFLKYFRDGTREGHDPKHMSLRSLLEDLWRKRQNKTP